EPQLAPECRRPELHPVNGIAEVTKPPEPIDHVIDMFARHRPRQQIMDLLDRVPPVKKRHEYIIQTARQNIGSVLAQQIDMLWLDKLDAEIRLDAGPHGLRGATGRKAGQMRQHLSSPICAACRSISRPNARMAVRSGLGPYSSSAKARDLYR